MTCNNCNRPINRYPYAPLSEGTPCGTLGRVITGRSVPGQNIRSKNGIANAMPQDTLFGTQNQAFNTNNMTPQKLGFDWGSFVGGAVVGFIVGAILLTATGRQMAYKAGQKIASKI